MTKGDILWIIPFDKSISLFATYILMLNIDHWHRGDCLLSANYKGSTEKVLQNINKRKDYEKENFHNWYWYYF